MNYEKQVTRLLDGAGELVTKLRNTENPDIQRLRDRVDAFVSEAKDGKSHRGHEVKIRRIPGSVLEYVREHPFLAVVTAASLAWTLGHLSSAARDQSVRS